MCREHRGRVVLEEKRNAAEVEHCGKIGRSRRVQVRVSQKLGGDSSGGAGREGQAQHLDRRHRAQHYIALPRTGKRHVFIRIHQYLSW